MNCAEFIGILKSGQPIILRRSSKEYLRLSESSLTVVTGKNQHLTLWLAANPKFKRILRAILESPESLPNKATERLLYRLRGFLPSIRDFQELVPFLRNWEMMRQARNWSSESNFPNFREIASFVYLTLIPEYWQIYLEVEGRPAEEASPLVEHENLHTDTGGYDY